MPKLSPAVAAARARRGARSGQVSVEEEWYVDSVMRRTDLALAQRVRVAVDFLGNKVVKNISIPVVKVVIGGRTRVVERSKPGEFPRADTTNLMKSIFWDVEAAGLVGFVGTPVWYGLELELERDRRFLGRTFDEERGKLRQILTGPIPDSELKSK